jgi:hypothetical protein
MLWHGFDILCVTQLEQERAGRRRMRRGACGERGVRADEKSVGNAGAACGPADGLRLPQTGLTSAHFV